MYLEEEAIHHTFNTLREISATHSLIVFDFIYKSILRREYTFYGEKAIHERYGEKSIYERVNKYNEAWRFGIEEGELNTFIEESGLKLLKTSTAKNLEQEYGFGTHRINGTHFIAVAEGP